MIKTQAARASERNGQPKCQRKGGDTFAAEEGFCRRHYVGYKTRYWRRSPANVCADNGKFTLFLLLRTFSAVFHGMRRLLQRPSGFCYCTCMVDRDSFCRGARLGHFIDTIQQQHEILQYGLATALRYM